MKSPKLYFYDTGIASHLLGIRNPEELPMHFAAGALFENMVISDIYKHLVHTGILPGLYFYRDTQGTEIDLLIDHGQSLDIIEIKSSMTWHSRFGEALKKFSLRDQGKNIRSTLIYRGESQIELLGHRLLKWDCDKSLFMP